MRKICFILTLLFTLNNCYSQKPVSKAAIHDFSTNFYWNYRYGNDFSKAVIFRILSANHSIADISVLMEKLETDVNGREELFKGLYDHFGNNYNNDLLFQNLYGSGISAIHSKEIADYIVMKYANNQTASGKKTSSPPIVGYNRKDQIKVFDDGEISYEYVDNIATDPNEKFFQGTKTFDGHIDDVYLVKIEKNKITITEPANADSVLLSGTILNGKILGQNGKESDFRYKSSTLYHRGNKEKGIENEWYVFRQFKENYKSDDVLGYNQKKINKGNGQNDKVVRNGNPNGTKYMGVRLISISAKSFEDDFNEGGKIELDVEADSNGKLVSASYKPAGSTLPESSKQYSIALDRARQIKYPQHDGGLKQTFIFNFTVK